MYIICVHTYTHTHTYKIDSISVFHSLDESVVIYQTQNNENLFIYQNYSFSKYNAFYLLRHLLHEGDKWLTKWKVFIVLSHIFSQFQNKLYIHLANISQFMYISHSDNFFLYFKSYVGLKNWFSKFY